MGMKKGHKLSAKARENIRNGQLARWAKIKAKVAQGEQHEAHCDDNASLDAVLNSRPGEIKVVERNCDGSVVLTIDPADDQHIIDTCMPRCKKTSFWSRLKNIFI